nr:DNA-binding domain-containing protein [Hymenobacter lucidus]
MQTVLTDSAGLGAAMRGAAAQAVLPLQPADIEQLIAPSSRMSGGQRLAVYQRGYFARLLECMAGQFRVLKQALGEELFEDFAREYLAVYPSETYTLGELGARFAQFLAETRPDLDAPPEEREAWPDFMIDLARLERAAFVVFDAPGSEQQPAVDWSAVADAALRLAPGCELLRFRYPVNGYYQAVYRGENPPLPPAQLNFLAITRVNFQLVMFELQPLQFQFLQQLQQGRTVQEAVAMLATQLEMGQVPAEVLWRIWRAKWLPRGFFVAS